MDWQEKIIAEKYDGDAKRFEADFADAVEEGRLRTVNWNDVVVEATILPTLKKAGQDAILHFLGYLPADIVIIPFEPYLRALIQNHRQSQMNDAEYLHQLKEHIKLIRNKDMECSYNTYITDDTTIYKNYERTFTPYGHVVKSRLTKFLGYEPKLEHSVVAEMWMRNAIAHDEIQLPDEMTAVDWKAIGMTKYREVLLEKGKSAADVSPLFKNT